MTTNQKQRTQPAQAQRHRGLQPAPGSQGPAALLEQVDLGALQRAVVDPGMAAPTDILALQRRYGNRAMQRVLQREVVEGRTELKRAVTSKEAVSFYQMAKEGELSESSYGSCVGLVLWNATTKAALIAHFWAGTDRKNLMEQHIADTYDIAKRYVQQFQAPPTHGWCWRGVGARDELVREISEPRLAILKRLYGFMKVVKPRKEVTFDCETGAPLLKEAP